MYIPKIYLAWILYAKNIRNRKFRNYHVENRIQPHESWLRPFGSPVSGFGGFYLWPVCTHSLYPLMMRTLNPWDTNIMIYILYTFYIFKHVYVYIHYVYQERTPRISFTRGWQIQARSARKMFPPCLLSIGEQMLGRYQYSNRPRLSFFRKSSLVKDI